jgi:hypothetical protein
MWNNVGFVITDVSEERVASIFSMLQLLVIANFVTSSLILSTLKMEATR